MFQGTALFAIVCSQYLFLLLNLRLEILQIKGLKSGRPLQAIEMPAFFAFKARDDDDDEPFERGIPLTQDPTLYGGGKNIFVRFVLLVDLVSTYAVAYRYHDPNGRIELDADYMISTDSGPCFRYLYARFHALTVCVSLSCLSVSLCHRVDSASGQRRSAACVRLESRARALHRCD